MAWWVVDKPQSIRFHYVRLVVDIGPDSANFQLGVGPSRLQCALYLESMIKKNSFCRLLSFAQRSSYSVQCTMLVQEKKQSIQSKSMQKWNINFSPDSANFQLGVGPSRLQCALYLESMIKKNSFCRLLSFAQRSSYSVQCTMLVQEKKQSIQSNSMRKWNINFGPDSANFQLGVGPSRLQCALYLESMIKRIPFVGSYHLHREAVIVCNAQC